MSDTVVFDIETQNFFTDPGVGWNNYAALRISVVCAYSYERDEYACFEESETDKLAEYLRGARRLVGFSINRYDVPVLSCYFQASASSRDLDLWAKERLDLLEEIEMATGSRVSLSKLAEANLGVAKDRRGSDAIDLYRSGRMDELKAYCALDVKLTKELFDIYRKRGSFLVPDRETGAVASVVFPERERHAALF